jgi:hypothetical protein
VNISGLVTIPENVTVVVPPFHQDVIAVAGSVAAYSHGGLLEAVVINVTAAVHRANIYMPQTPWQLATVAVAGAVAPATVANCQSVCGM